MDANDDLSAIWLRQELLEKGVGICNSRLCDNSLVSEETVAPIDIAKFLLPSTFYDKDCSCRMQ